MSLYRGFSITPMLCNSSPISENGGVAVLCTVAVLGTSHYYKGRLIVTLITGINYFTHIPSLLFCIDSSPTRGRESMKGHILDFKPML